MSRELINANANRIVCGTNSVHHNLTAYTLYGWFWENALIGDGHLEYYHSKAETGAQLLRLLRSQTEIRLARTRATTNMDVRATWANLNNHGAAKWMFYALSIDSALGNSSQFIYSGTLTNQAVAVTTYSTRIAGTGALTDDSANNWRIGGTQLNSEQLAGRIGPQGLYPRQLTLNEIRFLQRHPCVKLDSTVIAIWSPGHETSLADLSGNGNTGAYTGTTVADDPPIRKYGYNAIISKTGIPTPPPAGGSPLFFRRTIIDAA